MFVLKLMGDYDERDEILAISSDFDKLTKLKKGFADKNENYRKLYKEHQEKFSKASQEFNEINREFWLRNKHAITNPKHPDGLWVIIKINYPEPIFMPSGCLPRMYDWSKPAPKPAYEVTGICSERDIEVTRLEAVLELSKQFDYTRYKYIDWDQITEPIPVFFWDHVENPSPDYNDVGYRADSLIIEEIQEI